MARKQAGDKRQRRPRAGRVPARKLAGFDERILANGVQRLAGVDEAGRGALAGPVVAAAVVLRPDASLPELRDSKRLTPRKRQSLYQQVLELAECWAIGVVDSETVDAVNVLRATHQAMGAAVRGLKPPPDHLLVDGLPVPSLPIAHTAVVGGDDLSLRVAAASVIAKVERDRIMCELGVRYPQYGFAQNKGYGTRLHRAALRQHGACPAHRMTFGPLKLLAQEEMEL
ncbi:MAG: ribonuclease HII [Armatimonadota bacterium]